MNSEFGQVFLFLTDLAWKSRMTIPVLVTTVFLIMDIRLQIEISIQSRQPAAELFDIDDDDDDGDDLEEYTTDSDDENDYEEEIDADLESAAMEDSRC